MKVRWQSLKVKYAIIASFFIAVILLVNAFILVWLKYTEFEKDIDQRAFSFANLAVKPLSDGYDTYYYSGYFKFRELMDKLMSYDQDLTKILLVDVNGRILFNSDNLKQSNFIPHPGTESPRLKDDYLLNAVRKLKTSHRYSPGSDGDKILEIVSPHIEEWGRHKVSVIMSFSYRDLRPQVRLLIYQIAGLTFLSMLLTSLLAWVLADKITLPIVELTERARRMASFSPGEIRVEASDNEIKVLNDTFNAMTARIHENIQKLEMNNVKLAALNEELKELDRMKSDLLANVSHELRTPLTSIKGYTEYILEGKLGPVSSKQEKSLGVVQRNLDRLSKLINALLDYSLMDAERMVLNIKPFSLHILSRQIVATLASELERRDLQFKADISENLPLVMGDKDKLYQVLENLTINAIKFTQTGGTITVSADSFENDGKLLVELRVSDTGVGIAKSELNRIFDRFYQVDATSKRKYGGIGLGLAIARSIVEAHGGTITAQSEEHKGTTFIIRLPAIRELTADIDQLLFKKGNGEKYLLELIDPDEKFLQHLKEYLEEDGFATVSATTATKGLQLAKELTPDAIILDVLLPDQDGFNLLQTLKLNQETSSIPVVILSNIKERLKGLSLGAADYLPKPVQNSLLKASLNKILKSRDNISRTLSFIIFVIAEQLLRTML